jgi:hypothetical protein
VTTHFEAPHGDGVVCGQLQAKHGRVEKNDAVGDAAVGVAAGVLDAREEATTVGGENQTLRRQRSL